MKPLRLASSPAFRDLGGLPAADGRRVAYGRLYRADALSAPAAADRAVLDALGLRLICDLRGGDERTRTPCLAWLQPEPRRMHLDVSADLGPDVLQPLQRMMRGPDPDAAAAMMRATYAALPRGAAPVLGGLFRALAQGECPALVHCTAGKDRTGFITAMILTALDVPRTHVEVDYLLGSGRDPQHVDQPSSHMMTAILGRTLDPAEARHVHAVHRDYLDAAFAAIERDWGSPLNYLKQAAGIDAPLQVALQQALLEP